MNSTTKLVGFLSAAALMLAMAFASDANSIRVMTTEQKIAESDVVVIGTATEIGIPDGATDSFPLARIHILGVLKNSTEHPVGEDGELLFFYKTGSAETSLNGRCCKVGRQYLMFLQRSPTGHYRSVNAAHGVYDVSEPPEPNFAQFQVQMHVDLQENKLLVTVRNSSNRPISFQRDPLGVPPGLDGGITLALSDEYSRPLKRCAYVDNFSPGSQVVVAPGQEGQAVIDRSTLEKSRCLEQGDTYLLRAMLQSNSEQVAESNTLRVEARGLRIVK